jgi:hypothetical protein
MKMAESFMIKALQPALHRLHVFGGIWTRE